MDAVSILSLNKRETFNVFCRQGHIGQTYSIALGPGKHNLKSGCKFMQGDDVVVPYNVEGRNEPPTGTPSGSDSDDQDWDIDYQDQVAYGSIGGMFFLVLHHLPSCNELWPHAGWTIHY